MIKGFYDAKCIYLILNRNWSPKASYKSEVSGKKFIHQKFRLKANYEVFVHSFYIILKHKIWMQNGPETYKTFYAVIFKVFYCTYISFASV